MLQAKQMSVNDADDERVFCLCTLSQYDHEIETTMTKRHRLQELDESSGRMQSMFIYKRDSQAIKLLPSFCLVCLALSCRQFRDSDRLSNKSLQNPSFSPRLSCCLRSSLAIVVSSGLASSFHEISPSSSLSQEQENRGRKDVTHNFVADQMLVDSGAYGL